MSPVSCGVAIATHRFLSAYARLPRPAYQRRTAEIEPETDTTKIPITSNSTRRCTATGTGRGVETYEAQWPSQAVTPTSRNRRGIGRTLLIAAALSVIAPVPIRTGQKEPPPIREAWSSSFFCVKDRQLIPVMFRFE
jgi:hypothetical protein